MRKDWSNNNKQENGTMRFSVMMINDIWLPKRRVEASNCNKAFVITVFV